MRNATGRLHAPAGLLAVAALALTGCGSATVGMVLQDEQLSAELRDRGLDPKQVILPFGLTEEMRRWAHETAPDTLPPEERLHLLRERLLDPGKMSLEYQYGYTGTAIEVFEKRRANCLAFTNLFIGMARELGIPVYFLAVDDSETYRKEGDLVVVSDHVAAGYGPQLNHTIFDFSDRPLDDYRLIRRISDLTAIAMYHSNRGAEFLRLGDYLRAVRWLGTAVTIDPTLTNAWVNLGVAYRRTGHYAEAEEAYKTALERDPRLYSAYHDLASLLRIQEREEEAMAYELVLEKSPNRNPYTYLTLGDVSLHQGRLDEAERFYRRAVHLSSGDPEVYAALGELAVSTGDLRTARRMLKKAQKIGVANDRTQRLAQELEALVPGEES